MDGRCYVSFDGGGAVKLQDPFTFDENGGLMQSAANLAELSNKPEYDISEELSQAVELFVEMRGKGITLADFSAQGDFFRAAPSDEVMFLMGLFEENLKTPSGISGVLKQYARECKKIDTTTMDMFGTENPSKLEKLKEARTHYATDVAQQDANADVRGKYDEAPTEAEVREAERQKAEVKAKWTNPDGTPKKGYLCAPNGKPSRLTEDQWLTVRTPNFKRWFGDWEKLAWANAAMDFIENTAPVCELSGREFQKDGVKLTDKVSAYFDSIGNVAHSEELGDVVLDLKGVQDSLGHGIGRLKASAFMAVKDVIENGFIFNRETNWKNRKYNSAVFVAPIKIGQDSYICEVVVVQKPQGNKFYLHEVEIKETVENLFKTAPKYAANSQPSKLILGKHLAEVKGNVSRVVDENGEPMVVYHGSRWNPLAEKAGDAVFKGSLVRNTSEGAGFYFTGDKALASGFGEPVAAFLNIKKPVYAYSNLWTLSEAELESEDFDDPFEANVSRIKERIAEWKSAMESRGWDFYGEIDTELFDGLFERDNITVESVLDGLLSAENYVKAEDYDADAFYNDARSAAVDAFGIDGYVSKDYGDGAGVFVAFDSNQIKSATDNVGTFSENPDIRWSFRDEAELDALDKRHRELYEAYRNGDKEAFAEAAKLVADYAQGKGYGTKVYHGTGADGFNVAKADASEAQNGEGAQAHGMGLYMAEDREVAKEYQENAPKQGFYTIGGRTLEELGITPENFDGANVEGLVQALHSWGVEDAKRLYSEVIESEGARLKKAKEALAKAESDFGKERAQETIDHAKKQIARSKRALSAIDKILSILEENGLSISDYNDRISDGKVFDWFTNLKPGEVIDENKPLSEQPEIWEKFKNAWIDMWAYVKRKRKDKRYWEWFNPDKLEKDGYTM